MKIRKTDWILASPVLVFVWPLLVYNHLANKYGWPDI